MKTLNYKQGWGKYACLLLVLSLVAAGCKDNGLNGNDPDPGENPNNPPPAENKPNLLETIESHSNLITLAELLEGTTVQATLAGSNTTTVFAPSDAAFAKLDPKYLNGLTNQQKLDLLNYHLYNGDYPVVNEIKREPISSVHGDPIFVEIGQSFGNLVNNRAEFASTNMEASNGRVHIIDEVLIPDQFGTLADNLNKRYDFRKFYQRLKTAGLVEYLQKPGTKTVLAETDIALDLYEGEVGIAATDEQWKEIMQYHILEVDFTVTGPGTRTSLVTLSGDSVYLTVYEPGQFNINGNGGSPVTVVNATNGKIVFPAGIMLPDKYLGVLSIMSKRFYLQTARAVLAVAKLTGRLYNVVGNEDEKFTIFIFKDNAPGLNLPDDETELANLMKYHVLLEPLSADELQDGQTYTTWQGEPISISKNGNAITINGSTTIEQSNLIGENGVVHIIDRVLTPPAN